MDNFDIIYCICLPQRKEHSKKFFKIMKLKPIYIEPIWKNDIPDRKSLEKDGIVTTKGIGRDFYNKGRIANALSFEKTLYIF